MGLGNVMMGVGNGWMRLRLVLLGRVKRLAAGRERLNGPWECHDGAWERLNGAWERLTALKSPLQ